MRFRTGNAIAECLIVVSAVAGRGIAQDAAWARIQTDPANTPSGREAAVMVYDEQREVVVMHAGNPKG